MFFKIKYPLKKFMNKTSVGHDQIITYLIRIKICVYLHKDIKFKVTHLNKKKSIPQIIESYSNTKLDKIYEKLDKDVHSRRIIIYFFNLKYIVLKYIIFI